MNVHSCTRKGVITNPTTDKHDPKKLKKKANEFQNGVRRKVQKLIKHMRLENKTTDNTTDDNTNNVNATFGLSEQFYSFASGQTRKTGEYTVNDLQRCVIDSWSGRVKQQPAVRQTELLVQRPWESDMELHGQRSPETHRATCREPSAVASKLLHRAGLLAGRRYDDAGINYPIATVGLFPVSDVYDAGRREPSYGCAANGVDRARLGRCSASILSWRLYGVYGVDQYQRPVQEIYSVRCRTASRITGAKRAETKMRAVS